MIRVENLNVDLSARPVLRDVSFSLPAGTLCAIIGPNGSGKSTLLRALACVQPIASGAIKVDDQDFASLPAFERARRIAYLPQSRPVAWNMRVEDLVALGRFQGRAHSYAQTRGSDRAAIDAAMARTGADGLTGRAIESLSGGERARVHLARVFASPAPVLLLDEPAAALDLRHQLELADLLSAECETGRTILWSAHDLALVRRATGRVLVLHNGVIAAEGLASAVPDTHILEEVFGVRAGADGAYTLS